VRRRRRRRAVLPASGSSPAFGVSSYRSMRTTGRMMTTAGPDVRAIKLESRGARPAGRKLITVPMSLPPPRSAVAAMRPLSRFESHKVNALLTPGAQASANANCCNIRSKVLQQRRSDSMAASAICRAALAELPRPACQPGPFRRELDRENGVRHDPPPRGSRRRGRSAILARGVPRSWPPEPALHPGIG
jgi:hypothetical protein